MRANVFLAVVSLPTPNNASNQRQEPCEYRDDNQCRFEASKEQQATGTHDYDLKQQEQPHIVAIPVFQMCEFVDNGHDYSGNYGRGPRQVKRR